MAQEIDTQETTEQTQVDEQHAKNLLGPILCWAVVFADIGTSVYYVPGILYGTVGKLAGFFVFLTMSVFVLLTLKYVEVTYRFPQGGGVVTVAANAMNHWVGAVGGMFILVDYFLTAAISCLSGMLYLSVVVPAIGPQFTFLGMTVTLWITIVILILLGILNWVGISESAKVSMVGAIIAFVSDIAILFSVFTHISFSEFLSLFPRMFVGQTLTPISMLVGFAGSFLAFSGLESISQLSPVMKTPRKRVGGIALLLVVLTVGFTSPLLTMLSTLLQPRAAADPVLSSQIVSLLAGHWGGAFLQTEVAISASALLVFASNTAIIGSYHVFMALSRMEFFPSFVLQRNRLRGTPHYSIMLATGIPIVVLVLVRGNINVLGDMYAFGLLGAFTLTCLGLDIVRYRERKARRDEAARASSTSNNAGTGQTPLVVPMALIRVQGHTHRHLDGQLLVGRHPLHEQGDMHMAHQGFWPTVNFWLGVLTTILVVVAWSTNLISKPLATAFGGSVASIGMLIAYLNYAHHRRRGRIPVIATGLEKHLQSSVLAILTNRNTHNDAVIQTALNNAHGMPVVFLYIGDRTSEDAPEMFKLVAPHLDDPQAKEYFGRANHLAQEADISCRFVYRHQEPDAALRVWQFVHPHDTVIDAEHVSEFKNIIPDSVRYEETSQGTVAHLLKQWEHEEQHVNER